MVSSYIYLGVTFDSRLNMNLASNEFFSSAGAASAETIALIHRVGIRDWNNVLKLLGALVNSVIIYGSQVGSLGHLDTLERVQTNFFKRFLCLPRNTPGYAVRLECDVLPLSCILLKLILKWVIKLNLMGKERYPKILMEISSETAEAHNCIEYYSWFKLVGNILFQPINEVDTWMNWRDMSWNKANLILNKFRDLCERKDVESCRASNSLILLPTLNFNKKRKIYLDLNLDWRLKKLVAHLRLLNKYQIYCVIGNERNQQANLSFP